MPGIVELFLSAREEAIGLWAHSKLGGVVPGRPSTRPLPGTLMRHQRWHPHSLVPS